MTNLSNRIAALRELDDSGAVTLPVDVWAIINEQQALLEQCAGALEHIGDDPSVGRPLQDSALTSLRAAGVKVGG